ncbi:MAG: hypothetical protein ACLTIG_17330 [Roseburia hominis]
MAGMKRFVTYIYAYEEEKKGSNVGFARIEIRGQDARVEIHLRGVYAASAACRVYLFQREASGGKEATGVTGVLVGEMKLANGSGDGVVVLKGGRVGASPYGITEMEGLFFVIGEERILMSRWREGAPFKVGLSGFREWQPDEPKEKTAEKGAAAETAAQKEVREAAAAQAEQNSQTAAQEMAQRKQGEQPRYSRNRTAGWRQKGWRRMCRPGPERRRQRRGRRWRRFMPPSFPCAICSRNTTGMPCGRSSAENTNRRLCLRSGIRSASSWN